MLPIPRLFSATPCRFVQIAILITVSLSSLTAEASSRAVETSAPALYLEYFTIAQLSNLTIQTTGSSVGADPVLHLLRDNDNGTFTQVAYNDTFTGVEARISYTNPSGLYTRFLLVLRAKNPTAMGTCDLIKGGVAYVSAVPVGGNLVAASTFTMASGNVLHTVHAPGGSVAPAIFTHTTYTGLTISGVGLGNAVGGTSKVTVTSYEYFFLIGTPWIRDGATYVTPRVGVARVLSNDIATDTDGDGVGNSLEAELGLCAGTSGCTSNENGHGWDTDRDGLSDGDEIWGVEGIYAFGQDDLPFARWGANPLKKDVFLQVDYLTGIGYPLGTSTTNPFQWIRDNPSGYIGSWSGSLEAWADHAQEPFSAGPASQLHQAVDGVSLHLDVGVAPLDAADEALFGDWSTSRESRAIVPDFVVDLLEPITGDVTVTINGVNATFTATGLTPPYIGIALAFAILSTGEPVSIKSYTDNGDNTARLVFESTNKGVHFTRGISVPAGYAASVNITPESSESLRNHYSESDQVDSVRVGRIRYAVVTGTGGGGQAGGPAFSAGLAHGAFVHELGHTLGLEHWGNNAWQTAGSDCFPQYKSLMRYGIPDYRFSDVSGVDSINPAEAVEYQPFGASWGYSYFSGSPMYYATTSTGVDWNRDGSLAPSGTTWRSPALAIYGGGAESCAVFVQGKANIVASENAVGAVDLVRAGTRLYAFWATGSAIKYKFATLGSVGNKSCTGTADPHAGSCLTWSSTYTLLSGGSYQGVTSYAYGGYLWLSYHSSSNQLFIAKYSIGGGGTLSSGTTWSILTLYADNRTEFTPELVQLHSSSFGGTLAVIYLAETGVYRHFRWTGTTWGGSYPLLDPSGLTISGGDSPAALAWPDPDVTTFAANEKRTVALLPSTSGAVNFYYFDYSTSRWTYRSMSLGTTEGKPFISFRHQRQAAGTPTTDFLGNFMIGRMASCSGGYCARVRFTSSVNQLSPPGSTLTTISVGDYLQNVWAIAQPGTSATLYSDSTIDNTFGLSAQAVPGEYGLYFYPHADGSPKHSFGIRSDFRVMEDNICWRLGEVYAGCGTVNVLD